MIRKPNYFCFLCPCVSNCCILPCKVLSYVTLPLMGVICSVTAEDTSIYAMKQLGDDDPMKAEPVQVSKITVMCWLLRLLGYPDLNETG